MVEEWELMKKDVLMLKNGEQAIKNYIGTILMLEKSLKMFGR